MTAEWVKLPDWTPAPVAAIVLRIVRDGLPDREADILTRLAIDPRMKLVWQELKRRTRPDQRYVHPATPPPHAPERDEHGRQGAALAETLHFAFCAARDQMRVSKVEESERRRQEVLAEAVTFRRAAVLLPPPDAETFVRVADQWEGLATEVRAADDPMTVANDRGDRLARGVQIIIAGFLLERFGDRLGRTAATLAAVALGLKSNKVSERVSRSAFSGR